MMFKLLFCVISFHLSLQLQRRNEPQKKDKFGFSEIEISCVICKFVTQQTDKFIDVKRQCPELEECEMQKAREKLMKRDKVFAQKFVLLRELMDKQKQELHKPFEYKDDNNYYIIHPNHIEHYVDIVDEDHSNKVTRLFQDKEDKKKDEDGQHGIPDSGDKKTIIYHDVNRKNTTFPSEILIQHQYQLSNAGGQQENQQNQNQYQNKNSDLLNLWQKNQKSMSSLINNSSFLQLTQNIHKRKLKQQNNLQKNKLLQQKTFTRNNKHSYLQQDYNYQEVDLKPGEFIVRKKMPFQVDQRRLDRVFRDKSPNFRNNAGPYINLKPSKPNYFSGNFIIDKNINFGNYEPERLLIPSDNYEPTNGNEFVGEVSALDQFTKDKILPKLEKENKNTFKERIQPVSFLQNPIDFENVGNKIAPNYERPYKRAIYPTVNTEDNIFELMNDDISYTGYGKALFPPNPDALQPEDKCCTSYPCINQKPCPPSVVKNLKIQGLRFPQQLMKNTAQDLWFRFRQNDSKRFKSQQTPNRQELSFLQMGENSKKSLKNNEKQNLDPKTFRRLRRNGELPDPAWDCMYKNIENLVHFICEQEVIRLIKVSKTYIEVCKTLFDRIDVLVESWIYHDTTTDMCEHAQMCPI